MGPNYLAGFVTNRAIHNPHRTIKFYTFYYYLAAPHQSTERLGVRYSSGVHGEVHSLPLDVCGLWSVWSCVSNARRLFTSAHPTNTHGCLHSGQITTGAKPRGVTLVGPKNM